MPQKPLYETILFDDLRITPEFFEERKETINEKLSHAGTDLARERRYLRHQPVPSPGHQHRLAQNGEH